MIALKKRFEIPNVDVQIAYTFFCVYKQMVLKGGDGFVRVSMLYLYPLGRRVTFRKEFTFLTKYLNFTFLKKKHPIASSSWAAAYYHFVCDRHMQSGITPLPMLRAS